MRRQNPAIFCMTSYPVYVEQTEQNS